MTDDRRLAGAMTGPDGPLLFRARPGSGLEVAFTSADAGNLAFHVSGASAAGAGSAGDAGARVRAARRGVETALGIPAGRTEYLTQVHSARVVPAAGRGWGTAPGAEEADALVSADGRDPLAIMVADCLPVVFVSRPSVETAVPGDRDGRAQAGMTGLGAGGGDRMIGPTAVAHAGRRGLLDGVLQNTVARMRHEGSGHGPGDIRAWIGPAICGRCYEVPEQMRRDGAARIPATHSTTAWGTPALDLPAGAQAVLESLGVTVHRSPVCTLEDPRVFSHRRDPGRGRFVGLVWRRGDQQGTNDGEG